MRRSEKIQGNPWYKGLAVIVLLAAAFGAGVFGVKTLLNLPYRLTEDWQDTYFFGSALESYQNDILMAVRVSSRLGAEREGGGALTYAEVEDMERELEALERRLDPARTWFRYSLRASDGRELATNRDEDAPLSGQVEEMRRITFQAGDVEYHTGYYDGAYVYDGYLYANPGYQGYGEAWIESGEGWLAQSTPEENPEELLKQPQVLVLEYGVPAQVDDSREDEFFDAFVTWGENRANLSGNLTACLNLLALALLALVWILWSAGHKRGVEGVVTTWQEKIFFDLYAAAVIAAGVLLVACALTVGNNLYHQAFYYDYSVRADVQTYVELVVMGLGAIFAAGAACGALLLRTFTVRLKAGCLAKTTLLSRVAAWTARTVHDFLRFLPFTWKAVLGFLTYCVLSYILGTAGYWEGAFLMMYCLLQLAALFFLSWWVYGYYRLRQGTRTIAKGDLEYQIDTGKMPYDLRLQAEDLNNISAGLSAAVDEKMRSERFKAELITNVSHDLKTPLTSIINYVDLLKTTDQSDPKAAEYIQVLDRKSQRLKKLTEDLVEASKASTGVLAVTREKIGMSQLIDQALGEWEEKLSAGHLALVTTLPEGETWVYADGRHLWRVIDNLLSNCAKYAMEGTRVYLDLARGKGQVRLSVKNISREPLNVPPERLMERFVRGEESRTTEGSGLGLSIARSLTELQGGTFELAVDGDLFKAAVTLPQAN